MTKWSTVSELSKTMECCYDLCPNTFTDEEQLYECDLGYCCESCFNILTNAVMTPVINYIDKDEEDTDNEEESVLSQETNQSSVSESEEESNDEDDDEDEDESSEDEDDCSLSTIYEEEEIETRSTVNPP